MSAGGDRAPRARADIVPQQVTIASLLQQVQREDALELANGAPQPQRAPNPRPNWQAPRRGAIEYYIFFFTPPFLLSP